MAAVSGSSRAELAQAAAAARPEGARFVVALLPLDAEDAQALQLAGRRRGPGGERGRRRRAPGRRRTGSWSAGSPTWCSRIAGRSLLRVDLAGAGRRATSRWQRGEADVARELEALETRIALLERELDQPSGLGPELRALKTDKRTELHRRRAELANAPAAGAGAREASPCASSRSTPRFPRIPRWPAASTEHDAEVGALNLAWARSTERTARRPPPESRATWGPTTCLGCHPDTEPVWKQSKHAPAWETLEAQGKQHHLDCIGCHVVGWQQPGGRLPRGPGRRAGGRGLRELPRTGLAARAGRSAGGASPPPSRPAAAAATTPSTRRTSTSPPGCPGCSARDTVSPWQANAPQVHRLSAQAWLERPAVGDSRPRAEHRLPLHPLVGGRPSDASPPSPGPVGRHGHRPPHASPAGGDAGALGGGAGPAAAQSGSAPARSRSCPHRRRECGS